MSGSIWQGTSRPANQMTTVLCHLPTRSDFIDWPLWKSVQQNITQLCFDTKSLRPRSGTHEHFVLTAKWHVPISSTVFVSNYCRDLNAFPGCLSLKPHPAVCVNYIYWHSVLVPMIKISHHQREVSVQLYGLVSIGESLLWDLSTAALSSKCNYLNSLSSH